MKKIQTILGITALVLAGYLTFSCNSQFEMGEMQDENTVILTATVSRDALTKALDNTGHKTFAPGDQIVIFYTQTGGTTARAVSSPLATSDIRNEGTTADFSILLLGPAANGNVRIVYPASMAAATVDPDTNPANDATINFASLANQDGTLATLQSNFDLSVYDGQLTSDNKLPEEVHLSNRLAICEFTILNDEDENVNGRISNLNILAGDKKYSITPVNPAAGFGDGPLYVAMQPFTDQAILFTANNPGLSNFMKFVPSKTLQANNMYPVSVRMGYQHSAETNKNPIIAKDGDYLDGSLISNGTKIQIADGATVVLQDVLLIDVDDFDGVRSPIIKCLGDATIILEDNSHNALTIGSGNKWPAIFVPEGKTLTIFGNGTLAVDSHYGKGAGIGGGYYDNSNDNNNYNCGNIVIAGGTVLAAGGDYDILNNGLDTGSAGIGGGHNSTCGDITIQGGTITAIGGKGATGIGSAGLSGRCKNITIKGGSIGGTTGGFSWMTQDEDGAIGSEKSAGIGGKLIPGSFVTITSGASYIKVKKGANSSVFIGGENTDVKIDGVLSPDPVNTTFTHFDSYYDDTTWILTRKQ